MYRNPHGGVLLHFSSVVVVLVATASGCSDPSPTDVLVAARDLSTEKSRPPATEVPLGAFRLSVSVQLPEQAAWYRLTFDLAASVAENDASEVTELFKQREQRLRQEVATVFRTAEIEDLENARLSELRSRLVEALNRQIGRPLFRDVYLANFNAEVQ